MIAPDALLTDLYMLTMLQGFRAAGMEEEATYEFFVRDLPAERGFLLAAGLEQVLDHLEQLRFEPDQLDWLASTGFFSDAFLEWLGALRFRGEVHAMPEGTPFFPNEPILRVTAPLPQAQLVESRVINLLQLQTLIASKAARCVLMAPGKRLVDFGLRRAHGAEAGLLAARASYLAGFDATATVQAGRVFGIPLSGTMAHAYVQAHDSEAAAFESFARAHPRNAIVLLDTYDTRAAARTVVELASCLAADGIEIQGVRLDSGDLAEEARAVREILNAGGLTSTQILASGSIDEYRLRALERAGAPIDGYGIGTRLDVSADLPYLDCAYKLTEYRGTPRRKRSTGKATLPGRKQVFRHFRDGVISGDVLSLVEDPQAGTPLLEPVMREGRRLGAPPSLEALRARTREQLARLPEPLQRLEPAASLAVTVAPALHAYAEEADRGHERR